MTQNYTARDLGDLGVPVSLLPPLPTHLANRQALCLLPNPLLCQSSSLWRSESWKAPGTNCVLMAEQGKVYRSTWDSKLRSVGVPAFYQSRTAVGEGSHLFRALLFLYLPPNLPDACLPLQFYRQIPIVLYSNYLHSKKNIHQQAIQPVTTSGLSPSTLYTSTISPSHKKAKDRKLTWWQFRETTNSR